MPETSAPPCSTWDAPAASRSRRGRLTRRALLLAPLLAAGCGTVRVGQPAAYTPPPPGIDELYRADLLEALRRVRAGVAALSATAAAQAPADAGPSDGGGADPSDGGADGASTLTERAAAMLTLLSPALATQHAALSTAAELEELAEEQGAQDPSTVVPPVGDVAEPARDLDGLLADLVALRDLGALAARQISGAMARPVLAIAAHAGWAAARLARLAEDGDVPAPLAREDIEPTREVPADDPPSIGARVDYDSTMESAQQALWVAGYAYEVLAAQASGGRRRSRTKVAARHREHAEELSAIAEEDGCPVVVRQAVYPLPQGEDGLDAAGLLQDVSLSVLGSLIALTAAAPFERRSLPIALAMAEAHRAASPVSALPALLSLTPPEGAAASDGGS